MHTYDSFVRPKSKTIRIENASFCQNILYGNSSMVSHVEYSILNGTDGALSRQVSYQYDALGQIINETDSTSNLSKSYVYDSTGRLIRENNGVLNKTYTYLYDTVGNLAVRNTYAYTTGNLPENAVATVQYTYDTAIPDRLLTARGKSVSYNNQGCPVSYDGKTYTWAIHQLIQIKKGAPVTGTETWSYIYNGKGQRIRKEYVFTPPIKGPALIEYIQTRTTY